MGRMLTWHELQARENRQEAHKHLTVLARTWDDMKVYSTLAETQQVVFKLMGELQYIKGLDTRFYFGDQAVYAEFKQCEYVPDFKESYMGRFDIEVFEWVGEGYGIECRWSPSSKIANS